MTELNPVRPDGVTDDQMLETFERLAHIGVIEYVAPSIPLGEVWIVGVDKRIAKMNGNEAFCFLLGVTATESLISRSYLLNQQEAN